MQENQRHLNFNKFIEERSVEISKFLNDLEMDTKKKGHQALPRSIRRRAMSHNRYRIPKKLRKNMEQDLAKAQTMQKIPKCRKHIRKRRHLITAFKLRSSKIQWLSTHLWSARRMRMVGYYGYKIAFTPNNKSFRSAYRHFRHNTCLVDLSYYNCLSLRFKNATAFPKQIQLKQKQQIPQFDKIYEIEVYSSSTKQRLVCPAFLIRIYQPQNWLCLKIFFHPAAQQQISRLKFQSITEAQLEHGQCDIYLLTGPQSAQALSSAMEQYGLGKQPEISTIFYQNNNKILYFSKNNDVEITNKPRVDYPVPESKLIKQEYNVIQNSNLREKMLIIYKQMIESKQNAAYPQISHKKFWEYYKMGQNKSLESTVFKVTLRSRYTHKRKNKVSKVQKKKIIQAEKQSPRERKPKRQNAMQDEGQLSSSLNFSKQIYLQTPVHKYAVLQETYPIAVGQVGQGMMKGLLLFCSNSHSCKMWRLLSHCHLKVIGRRQYAHMHLQSNFLLFPQNYVQTFSFSRYFNEKKAELFNKFTRIPLQKQPNYYLLNSPYPFGLPCQQAKIVSLEMVGKGQCLQMSYICQLIEEDLKTISNYLQDGRIGIVLSQNKIEQDKKKNQYKTINDIESDLKLTNPKRKIIGQITTGGYLYSHSKEGGIGFISLNLISSNYLQKYGGYIFIRKRTSRHYMLGQITKIF